MISIYLAGPDVFLPDAVEAGKRKKVLCAERGFEGLYPFDNEIANDAPNVSKLIFEANVKMIERADAVICNLTPFRGLSADVGTVFELGLAYGLKKPVFGYTNDNREYRDRISNRNGFSTQLRDAFGLLIEDFGLRDNLMIDESLDSGKLFFTPDPPLEMKEEYMRFGQDAYRELAAFSQCLDAVEHYFNVKMAG